MRESSTLMISFTLRSISNSARPRRHFRRRARAREGSAFHMAASDADVAADVVAAALRDACARADAEVIAAAEALKAGGVTKTIFIHGWELQMKQRLDRSGRQDFTFGSGRGPKLNSIPALRRRLAGQHDRPAAAQPPPQLPLPPPPLPPRRRSLQEAQLQRSHATPGLGEAAIGRRCAVFWTGCSPPTWFSGTVRDFCSPRHLIVYDDGDSKWHDLAAEIAIGHLECFHFGNLHGYGGDLPGHAGQRLAQLFLDLRQRGHAQLGHRCRSA